MSWLGLKMVGARTYPPLSRVFFGEIYPVLFDYVFAEFVFGRVMMGLGRETGLVWVGLATFSYRAILSFSESGLPYYIYQYRIFIT